MRPSCVVFDFDNTLTPTYTGRRSLFLETLREWSPTLTEDFLDTHWAGSLREVVHACAPAADYDAFITTYESRLRAAPVTPLPGASSLLPELVHRGVACGVFSASSRRLIEADLDGSGLSPFVTFIVSCDDSPHGKPHPESLYALLVAMHNAGLDRSRALFVGDSVSDAALARRARLPFAAVTTGKDTSQDFKRAGLSATDIFPDLWSLEAWLSRADWW